MSLLDDVSIVVTPNGYKAGELYAVVPVPTEGAELVTNGDFATDSDWVLNSNWSISNGTANADGTSSSVFWQDNVIQDTTTYSVTYTLSNFTQGSLNINLSGSAGVSRTSAGTYTETITSGTSPSGRVYFEGSGSFIVSIDNVSVKEYTAADMDVTRATAATRVDEAGLVNFAEIIGSELVTNGDFELNSDWNNFSTPTTSEQSTEQSHTGTYSWKVIADATQEGIFSPNNFSITNGNSYSVSLWIYSVSGNSIKSGLNNTNVSVFTERTVIAGQWTNITYEATATSTGASYISILSQNSLNYYVDDVSVKELTRDNVPRIDYTGGGCPHILAEPQRTNEVTYSEDLNQASTVVNATVLLNQGSSPKGDNSANKFTADTVFPNARLSVTTVINQKYTTSIYAKYEGYQFILLDFKTNFNSGSSGAWFDIINGTIGTTQSDVTFTKIEQLSNNWYRISATSEATSSGTGQVRIHLCDTDGSNIIAGATGLSNFVWGFQIEAGSYATSYIPTSGSTVTRNQDIFTRDGIGSLINSTEGVLFVEMALLSDDGSFKYITLTDVSGANKVQVDFDYTSSRIQYLVASGGLAQCNIKKPYSGTNIDKLAFKWKENDFAIWINGVEVGTDISGLAPIGLNTLKFSSPADSNNFEGKIKQLQVYKTALTDAQLTSLTT